MIITFCGHAEIYEEKSLEDLIYNEIEKVANGQTVTFYVGLYGDFDWLAKNAALRYKNKYKNSKIVFVTPYIDEKYLQTKSSFIYGYDEILYPDLEKTPKRFAISKRNIFMADKADFVIAFVRKSWGGAAKMLEYVKNHKKPYVNLAEN